MEAKSNKRSLRFSKNAKRPVKYKNVPHEMFPRIIASGHNANDAKFLAGNKGLLMKLQQKMA